MPTKKPYGVPQIPILEGPPRRSLRNFGMADPENRPSIDPGELLSLPKLDYDPNSFDPRRDLFRRDPARPGALTRPIQAGVAPILNLTAQVLLAPGAPLSPSFQPLKAPQNTALLIDEIRFEVAALTEDNANNNPAQCVGAMSAGMLVAAQFKLGGVPLTDGFIPIAMFGPAICHVAEGAIVEAADSTLGSVLSQYVWRPSTPIYVPAGAVLEPTFENRGFINLNIRVRVSYTARPAPTKLVGPRILPYIMGWATPVFAPNGTEVEQDSPEDKLINNSGGPVQVEDIIGRVAILTLAAGIPSIFVVEGTHSDPTIYISHAQVLDQAKLQLTASWGPRVIRDWIPWPVAFDIWTRSIPAPHEMPVDGYYFAQIKGGGTVVADTQYFAALSIIGSREV